MTTTPSREKQIIIAILAIFGLVIFFQNLYMIHIKFLFISIKLPLILLLALMFAAGRYTARTFQNKQSIEELRQKYAEWEATISKQVSTGLDKGKTLLDETKQAYEEQVNNPDSKFHNTMNEATSTSKKIWNRIKKSVQTYTKKWEEKSSSEQDKKDNNPDTDDVQATSSTSEKQTSDQSAKKSEAKSEEKSTPKSDTKTNKENK